MKKITSQQEEYVLHINFSDIKSIDELETVLLAKLGNEMNIEKIKSLAKAIMETASKKR